MSLYESIIRNKKAPKIVEALNVFTTKVKGLSIDIELERIPIKFKILKAIHKVSDSAIETDQNVYLFYKVLLA